MRSEPLRSPRLEDLASVWQVQQFQGQDQVAAWVLRLISHLGVLLLLGGAVFHRKQPESGNGLPPWISIPQWEGKKSD